MIEDTFFIPSVYRPPHMETAKNALVILLGKIFPKLEENLESDNFIRKLNPFISTAFFLLFFSPKHTLIFVQKLKQNQTSAAEEVVPDPRVRPLILFGTEVVSSEPQPLILNHGSQIQNEFKQTKRARRGLGILNI